MGITLRKNYVDYGCGFPVIIDEVKVFQSDSTAVNFAMVDHDKLEREVLVLCAGKKAPLTGDQVRFIRLAQGLTLAAFGERVGVSHSAVSKWESRKAKSAEMSFSNEFTIRARLLHYLDMPTKPLDDITEACLASGAESQMRVAGLLVDASQPIGFSQVAEGDSVKDEWVYEVNSFRGSENISWPELKDVPLGLDEPRQFAVPSGANGEENERTPENEPELSVAA